MPCAQCGTDLIPGKPFCASCGTRIETGCPSCGAPVLPEYRFCPECGAALGDHPAGAAPGSPALAPRAADPRLRHLPAALADKLRTSQGAAGERKRVTVLFCDLAGSTAIAADLDPEIYREVLDQYLEACFAQIYRFEGLVNQLAGDGMMALFGAPIAHEDDPERAIRAALAMQVALGTLSERLQVEHGFSLEARIGIHTGMVVAGTVGNNLKMDYTAIGDTTNLASRMQALAAPGSILISDATARLVGGRVRLGPAGPFQVKGRSEPVAAHEVLGIEEGSSSIEIAATRGLTPFVGRDAELSQLEACFQRVGTGLAQVVTIVGPAGSGKSRLVYELHGLLAREGATLLEARCSSITQSVPYHPWTTMLLRSIGALASDSPAELRQKLEQSIGKDSLASDEELPYLLRVLGVATPEIAAEPGEVTIRHVFRSYQGWLERLARRAPLILVLEDLQWIDDASREALTAVLQGLESFATMIIATHRPDYQYEWQVHAALTQLRLRPLSDEHATRVVRACAGGEVPTALAQRILRRAEGNPLFLEELTRGLLEGGALTRQDGQLVATRAIESIEIPATVQELIAARLDRLRPGAKRVAQVASVLGRQFGRGALVELLTSEEVDVSVELAELEHHGIIHRKTGVSGDEYRFGESFTRDVAYDGLLLRERRLLHDRIGEQLLEGDAGVVATRQALIGHHFAHGSDPERGIRMLLEAAEAAERFPSYGDAIRLYRQAWELAESTLQEGREGTRSDPEHRRLAMRAATSLTNTTVLYGAAHATADEAAARRAIELARELGESGALARVLSSLGFLVMNSGRERFAEGLGYVQEGFDIARASGEAHAAATLKRALALGYLLDGRFSAAQRTIEEALAELEKLGDRARLSDTFLGARFFLYRVLHESDQIDAAEEAARATQTLAIEANNRTVQSASTAGIAMTLFLRGRYAEAMDWASRAYDVAARIENIGAIRSALSIRILCRAELGDRAGRQAELDAMQRGLLSQGDFAMNVDLIVSALTAIGELDGARRVADMAARRTGGRLRDARNTLSVAEVALAAGKADACTPGCFLDEVISLATEIGARSIAARARLVIARLAAQRGRTELAEEDARVALLTFEELGLEHYARKAREVLGERLQIEPAA